MSLRSGKECFVVIIQCSNNSLGPIVLVKATLQSAALMVIRMYMTQRREMTLFIFFSMVVRLIIL